MNRCCPSAPTTLCDTCQRYAARRPRCRKHGYERVVIDPSAIGSVDTCVFYVDGMPHRRRRVDTPMFDASQIGACVGVGTGERA